MRKGNSAISTASPHLKRNTVHLNIIISAAGTRGGGYLRASRLLPSRLRASTGDGGGEAGAGAGAGERQGRG